MNVDINQTNIDNTILRSYQDVGQSANGLICVHMCVCVSQRHSSISEQCWRTRLDCVRLTLCIVCARVCMCVCVRARARTYVCATKRRQGEEYVCPSLYLSISACLCIGARPQVCLHISKTGGSGLPSLRRGQGRDFAHNYRAVLLCSQVLFLCVLTRPPPPSPFLFDGGL